MQREKYILRRVHLSKTEVWENRNITMIDPVVETLGGGKEDFLEEKNVAHLNFPKLLLTQEHMLKPTVFGWSLLKIKTFFQP